MRTNADPVVHATRRRGAALAISTIVALAAMAPALHAQEPAPGTARGGIDARWEPWLGCWELLRDTAHEAAAVRPGSPLARERPGAETSGEARVCVEPEEGGAVRLRTEVQGRTVLEETVVADGSSRPFDDGRGCGGWRQTEWSRDGRRLFGRAELACGGGPRQTVSQLSLFTGDAWFEFQGVTIDGRQAVRVRRYRRVDDVAGRTAPGRAPARAFDLEAVKEASGKVDSLVLEAALAETASRFRLDGRAMLALKNAGVPGDVTDLMVALSYPQRFRVSRPRAGGGFVAPVDPTGWFYDPGWYYDPFWGYMPFAYSSWGAGGWWWGHPGSSIAVPDGGGGVTPREGRGRVINNRGYTRIEAREPDRARTRGASSGSTASTGSTGSSSDSGSSSSGVSSSGYSSGGSSDGGGRTAVPR